MKFDRLLTAEGLYHGMTFSERVSSVRSGDGSKVKEVAVIVPDHWSQNAVDILAQKYMRRAGLPARLQRVPESGIPEPLCRHLPAGDRETWDEETVGRELDARQVFRRIAGAWAYHGLRNQYFSDEQSALIFFDEMQHAMAAQMLAPATPQWLNTGLGWAYGLTGPESGLWGIRANGVAPLDDSYTHPQLSACYIHSVEDTLIGDYGITSLIEREARTFKFGGGAGGNFSNIRGEGEKLSGGGCSSGLLSWLKTLDANAGAIKSGGTSRRAAKMVILDDDHPDLWDFIHWKVKEEDKVAALVAGSRSMANFNAGLRMAETEAEEAEAVWAAIDDGVPSEYVARQVRAKRNGLGVLEAQPMTTDYEGDAYQTVTGQNANNTIRASDLFMEAVAEGGFWELKERTTGRVKSRMIARELWNGIVNAAWRCADPGLHFKDTVNDWNTVATTDEIRGSNPCCFVGSTFVDTSEGRIRIDELVRMYQAGEQLPYAYCRDVEGNRPTVGRILRGWKAGEVRQTVRITTDRGVRLECTPEHRFLTFKGEWVRADELKMGTSLRKIARHRNEKRRNAVMISDSSNGKSNGTEFQHRWLWVEINGPIPEGFEVHHKDENPENDRYSNLEIREISGHRSEHTIGLKNPNAVQVSESELVAFWESVPTKTPNGWNNHIDRTGMKGKIPRAQSPALGGRIRGKTWAEFSAEMQSVANDVVASVQVVNYSCSIPVYDIEVQGSHNFGVSDTSDVGSHSIIAHNSEYLAPDDTSCNLASHRLTAYQTGSGHGFNVESFLHTNRMLTVALDISCEMASYPSEKIAEGTRKFRNLGLGYADLGAFLMRRGLGYDSNEGRSVCSWITALMHLSCLRTSVELADRLGAFPAYRDNDRRTKGVINNFLKQIDTCPLIDGDVEQVNVSWPCPPLRSSLVPSRVLTAITALGQQIAQGMPRYGIRNANVTLLAPTGTIGIVMDCDTTGIEPDFALVKWKRLAGGGNMKIVNQSIPVSLNKLGYTPDQVDKIVRYVVGNPDDPELEVAIDDAIHTTGGGKFDRRKIVEQLRMAVSIDHVAPGLFTGESLRFWNTVACGHQTLEGCKHLKPEHEGVFDCANPCGDGKRSLRPMAHVRMMAHAQAFLSMGISKTVNLPADATPQDVSDIYRAAWTAGVKCIAVYRDQSKLSQPLSGGSANGIKSLVGERTSVEKKAATLSSPPTSVNTRRSLPDRRSGDTQKFRIAGQKFYLRTGEYKDGSLGEIFLDCHKEGATLKAMTSAVAQAVSIGLQYGVPLAEFVDAFTFTRFDPSGIVTGHAHLKAGTSVLDVVFRDLAIHYLGLTDLAHVKPEVAQAVVANGVHDGVHDEPATDFDLAKKKGYDGSMCGECGSFTMLRTGYCLRCDTCFTTTGCT